MTTSHSSTDRSEHAGSGAMCTGFEAGYALHPIQRIAAIATASQWRDAFVTAVTPDGLIAIVDLESGAESVLWHFADLTDSLVVGEPVSFHPEYNVLAAGRRYLSVRP